MFHLGACLLCCVMVNVLAFKHLLFRRPSAPTLRDTGTGFTNQRDYIEFLRNQAALPKGWSVGATRFHFTSPVSNQVLPMNMTIIMSSQPSSSFAAMFTSNLFPGAPVLVGKERMKTSKLMQAIVVNNKISNVCPSGTADRGVSDTESICQAVAQHIKLPSSTMVFPSSTGIIGWRLPVGDMIAALPSIEMQSTSLLPAAAAITTTDRFPKLHRYVSKDLSWSLVGIAKGAGMIEPNMATMLAYILTDLDVPKEAIEKGLRNAVTNSFNTISIDGDQSTSDTVFAISSQVVPLKEGHLEEFHSALEALCVGLSEDIVRNGEGTQHVIKVLVSGCSSQTLARDVGRAVVNSNLVKCAIAGCDPNVGRVIAAIGSFLGKEHPSGTNLVQDCRITMGGVEIFNKGSFQLDPAKEKTLSDYMLDAQLYPTELPEDQRNYLPHKKSVEMTIEFSGGSSSCLVIGSDLTREYVDVNADYRS